MATKLARKGDTIQDLIETKPERKLLQARVATDLLDQADEVRKRQGISWRALLEACLRRYLLEDQGGRS